MGTRIIVKLDAKPPYIVKPVHFEGLRKVGLVADLAEKYYQQGADEVFYVDIVASLYQREILFEEIERVASKLFVPLAVGGGVRSVEDFSRLFHCGADKVVVNTHAVQESPDLINLAADVFGNQAVVLNIEAKQIGDRYDAYTDCGRIPGNRDVVEWAVEAEERGAGEILLQSVDRDGRQRGFDLELAQQVVDAVRIPVVVASGASSMADVKQLIEEVKPSGVAIASLFHYDRLTVFELKEYLLQAGIEMSKCRV